MKQQLQLNIPINHAAFAGHFPGMPIVPGVVLLDEAVHAICEASEFPTAAWQINSVKFVSPLLPGEAATIRFETQDSGAVRFEIVADMRSIAVGSITLGAAT
jgi:3-hydroxyacyl-[acyl-carrier-protein] dehydratase